MAVYCELQASGGVCHERRTELVMKV